MKKYITSENWINAERKTFLFRSSKADNNTKPNFSNLTEFNNTMRELKKFFSKKYDFYKEQKSIKDNILLVDRERVDAIFTNTLYALAISKKYNLNIILLTDQKKNTASVKIHEHLGFEKIINGFSLIVVLKNIHFFVYSIFLSLFATYKIYKNNFNWFINKYYVKDILIGDLIYDHNIRYHHRYQNPKIDFYFIKLLIKSTFRLLCIRKYFKKYSIKSVFVGTEVYAFNCGIALRVAVFNKIKNYVPVGNFNGGIQLTNFRKNHIVYGPETLKYDSVMMNKFKSLKTKKSNIEKFFKNRKKSKIKGAYTRGDFIKANQSSRNGEKFLKKIKSQKKNIILYTSHALSDSTHLQGLRYVFNNYYEQMLETIKFAYYYGDNNVWVFRSHPASLNLNENNNIEKLIKKYKKKNIFLCPPNVSITSLYQVSEVVITGRGTSGLEFACEGKPVIIAGKSTYSGFDIVNEAKTKFHYLNLLKNVNKLKKLNKNKISLAKKILFFFEKGVFVRKFINFEKKRNDNFESSTFLTLLGNKKLSLTLGVFKRYLASDFKKGKIFKKIFEVI